MTSVSGMYHVWYRHGNDQPWRCYIRKTQPSRYSQPKDWLRQAEEQMSGRNRDVLWRKNDEQARRLVWC